MKKNQLAKTFFAILLLGLALIRWALYDISKIRMDNVFLGIIGFAILIYFIPWENLKTFKAAGVEFSIEQSPVKAAISGLGLGRIKDKKLLDELKELEDEMQLIRGGRVIWIDDKPHNITGERRLLRALGIQIVTALSSENAERVLESDNDFDLIISDVQRFGESYKLNNGNPIHEGANFIVKLRHMKDPNIKAMPVVFYAAYPWERLEEFTLPARQFKPDPEISNSFKDFLPKVIKQMAQSRESPIRYSEKKVPTSARGSHDDSLVG